MKKLLILPFFLILNTGHSQYINFTPSDSLEIISYLDGAVEAHMEINNIAGATMAVVKNGEIRLLKGYGYADLKNKVPVDPEKTLFRIGSISKMFVWTAIMQLYQEGRISLDDNINDYFENFKIPDTYPEPVTIKNLMTHTPGFEDLVIKLFVRDTEDLLPLEDILSDQIPARVRPPGTNASYSNHGTGMAALIVEKVSGMSFSDYVEEKITGPLNMSRTSFRQPLPQNLATDMSKGYYEEGNELKEGDFELVPLYPVGAASATAADIARFMIMHLQLGQLDSSTIVLDSATAQLMQSPAHRHHPSVNPMRYGFMDVSQNGETIIGHGGDTFWFHSLMALWPEHNLGLFLSFNSQAGGGTYMDILEAFCDRYFPESLREPRSQNEDFLKKYTGTFESNRYPHRDLFKISKAMSVFNVSATEDGYLKTASGNSIDYWFHQKDHVFRNLESSDVIVFKEDDNGNIRHMYLGLLPIFAMDRIQGIHTPATQMTIAVVTGLVLLITFIYWALIFFMKRRLEVSRMPADMLPGPSKTVAWITILLVIVFYLGVSMVFSNPFEVVYGIPVSLKILLAIPFAIIALALLMAILVLGIWKQGNARLSGRIWYTLVWLCILITIWQWNYWNFLGWRF